MPAYVTRTWGSLLWGERVGNISNPFGGLVEHGRSYAVAYMNVGAVTYEDACISVHRLMQGRQDRLQIRTQL